MDDRVRVWAVRVVAPIAFLAAATVLVVLVQQALRDDGSPAANETPPTASVIITGAEPEPNGAAQTGATAAEQRFYRIRPGDTLEAIAAEFDTTVERLLELNPGIDPLALTPNERIRVS